MGKLCLNRLRRFYFVIVIYQINPNEARTLKSIRRFEDKFGVRIKCDVYINGSDSYKSIESSWVSYFYLESNEGLAKNYNKTLEAGFEQGYEYLVTLDQDSEVSEEYLLKLLEVNEHIDRAFPIVKTKGVIASPALLKNHFPRMVKSVNEINLSEGSWLAINSFSVYKITTLRKLGGFDELFWLDHLDHAISSIYDNPQFKSELLFVEVDHELSVFHARLDGDRLFNFTRSEIYFMKKYGDVLGMLMLLVRICFRLTRSIVQLDLKRTTVMVRAIIQFWVKI